MPVKRPKKPKTEGKKESKKSPAGPNPNRHPLFKFLSFSILLGGSLLLLAFFLIDYKVADRLKRAEKDVISAIYSDVLAVDPQKAFANQEQLRNQLLKRRYREVSGQLSAPGEFNFKSNELQIYTREFKSPDGLMRPAKVFSLKGDYGEDQPRLYLEPLIISVLGDGDIRSTEYRNLNAFPHYLREAVLAIEDERFYQHSGVDMLGIIRALYENLRAMSIVQGGSTITQQLAKNLFFTPERSIWRKVLELLAALSLEFRLSKDQILELYLNEIYLGQEGAVSIHGMARAANVYFGKKLQDLTLSESALLAAIIKAPSFYSPRRHLERALGRQKLVLDKMYELGRISGQEFQAAGQKRPLILKEGLHGRHAPHFVSWLQSALKSSLNMEAAIQHGISIYTGIDVDMQQCAQDAISSQLALLEKNFPGLKRAGEPLEAGLMAVEPFSGKIKAWVGGRDYSERQFDHVAQALRQIGSTIKPFLYLTALDGSLNSYKVATTLSILSDRPIQIDTETRRVWEPENYDREYRGDVTLRYALENSLNVPAVSIAQKFGIKALAHTVQSFHLTDRALAVPALALGALDTTLYNLTGAYSALANGGVYVSPRPYISVLDRDGQVLLANTSGEERIANSGPVYVLTDILRGVVERGTARGVRRLGYEWPAAGKTGTSNETRDNWFVGFSPDLAAGVWVGYDDNKKIGLTGGATAVPIWTSFMQCVRGFYPGADFAPPEDVVVRDVDPETGYLVTPTCPSEHATKEVFVRGTEPRLDCHSFDREPQDRAPTIDGTGIQTEGPRRRRKGFWESLFG